MSISIANGFEKSMLFTDEVIADYWNNHINYTATETVSLPALFVTGKFFCG